MAQRVPNALRDEMITAFRQVICQEHQIIPYPHQADWWLATDGVTLLDVEVDDGGMLVRLPDSTLSRRAVVPRGGGRARVVSLMGAFKTGKSYGAAVWAASFAAVPNARVQLVGIEYDVCEPEFSYLCELLLAARGKHAPLIAGYESLQNRPRDGRMYLDLKNGARFEAKSWERRDTLKGKEVDAYIFCESYMLPGLECLTDNSQNLRARDGFAVFPTTPHRPWVQEVHDRAHSDDPQFAGWHCTCGVPAESNPITFSAEAKARDRKLMTAETFAIHYEGRLGKFTGRVYAYQRGQRHFTRGTHPDLWRTDTSSSTRDDLVVPAGWEIVGGGDTGTFYSALLVAFSPDGEAFVLQEFPNYRYTAQVPERDDALTIPEWAGRVTGACTALQARAIFWADPNSQFKRELVNYGITLLGNKIPPESRTEVAREYFVHGRIWLAPWLTILPFELENAGWPEDATATGRFARVKDRDHTLDCLEHILSQRPKGRPIRPAPRFATWAENFAGRAFGSRAAVNTHLGRH